MRNLIEDKQSRLAWPSVNRVSERKSTSRAKLKAARQEQIQTWKEHLKNLLKNSPKVTDKPITKIIYCQQEIKLGKFSGQELNVVLTKIENNKAAGLVLVEIPPEVWMTRKFDDILLRFCNDVEGCVLPFPHKADLGIMKFYRGKTLTSIDAEVYNDMLHIRAKPEIEKILKKNQNDFQRNRSMTSQILTTHRTIEGVHAKKISR